MINYKTIIYFITYTAIAQATPMLAISRPPASAAIQRLGPKHYSCTYPNCTQTSPSRSNMKIHVRTHTGEKPKACTLCPARFASPSALARHIRIHTGERPFKCSKCSVRFSGSDKLIRHFRGHTGEKPYVCITCHTGFAESGNLARHMRTYTHNAKLLSGPELKHVFDDEKSQYPGTKDTRKT